MRVSLIQMESTGTREENEEKAFRLMNEAIKENTDVICLSEYFLYWGKDFDSGKVTLDDIEKYKNYAKENNVNIILGSVALKSNIKDKITNTCFVIDRFGNIVLRYDKKYMYTVNRNNIKFDEIDDTIPGNSLGICEIDNVKVGIGICFDLRFPEYFRELTKNGVKVIFLPSHFKENTGRIAWNILTRARAIENQVYFLACNQTGEGLCGRTQAISYDGEVIKSLDKEEGILTIDIDIEKLDTYRKEFPVLEQM